jgi:hypothetical protein
MVTLAACARYDGVADDPEGGLPADPATPRDGSASTSTTSGAPGRDATTPDAQTTGEAGADVGAPTDCNDLTQLGADVPLTLASGSPDPAVGGPLTGTYVLTAVHLYAPLLPGPQTIDATTVAFDNLSYRMIVGGSRNSGTFSQDGGTLKLAPTCGVSNALTGTTLTYVSGGATLKVFSPLEYAGSTFTFEYVFTAH